MTLNITARNVNDAYASALHAFHVQNLKPEPSRGGPVIRYPNPVIVEYIKPDERVLFDKKRDANPFFHLMEAIWMMAGEDNIAFLTQYNGQVRAFSDDGHTLHGAYGNRWRWHWHHDQIEDVVNHLRKDPTSRRVVMAMYDPNVDAYSVYKGRDVPCNTHIYFAVRGGCLDMTVMARSNDMVWGALGANAVHMSFLHEFIAIASGLMMGSLYQFSNDYHIYIDRFDPERLLQGLTSEEINPYTKLQPFPILETPELYGEWLDDAINFMEGRPTRLADPFWTHVAVPMERCWSVFIGGDIQGAREMTSLIKAEDWSLACDQWLARRLSHANS
jgi:thymidylate synthase